jgi:hypothetical protein
LVLLLLGRPLLVPTAALTMMLLLLMMTTASPKMLLLLMVTTTSTTIPSLVPPRLSRQRRRPLNPPTLQINIHPPLILLGSIVQPQLPTQPLHPRLDLLHMARGVIPLADNDMQVRLAGRLGVADALLKDVLGLFDKLPVQVDGVLGDAAGRVVLAEDELGRLLVVLGLLLLVPLTLVRELLGTRAVAALVCFVGLTHTTVQNESTNKGVATADHATLCHERTIVPDRSRISSCRPRPAPDRAAGHTRLLRLGCCCG